MTYSADRIGERWKEISEEAIRCMVTRPLSKEVRPKHNNNTTKEFIERNREKWVRGWTKSNDYGDDYKWYNYEFVYNGIFTEENNYDFPITYGSLVEMNKHFKIVTAGYSWLLPNSHIQPHQDFSDPDVMTLHLGLYVPDFCVFNVSRAEYKYENGKFVIFDDNDVHESYNLSNESLIILYIKAKIK